MSAAEKLKALVDGFFEDTEPLGYEAPVEIIAALPQIVVVVEAAENAQRILPKSAGSVSEWNSIAHIEGALTAALAALDEKLASDR